MVLSKTLHFADPALYDVSGEQKWIRGTANSEGYFTLQNPTSGKFLTAASPTSTTISGTYIQTFYKCVVVLVMAIRVVEFSNGGVQN